MNKALSVFAIIILVLAIFDIVIYLALDMYIQDRGKLDVSFIVQEPKMPVIYEIDDGPPDPDEAFYRYQVEQNSKDRYREIRQETAKDDGERLKVIC